MGASGLACRVEGTGTFRRSGCVRWSGGRRCRGCARGVRGKRVKRLIVSIFVSAISSGFGEERRGEGWGSHNCVVIGQRVAEEGGVLQGVVAQGFRCVVGGRGVDFLQRLLCVGQSVQSELGVGYVGNWANNGGRYCTFCGIGGCVGVLASGLLYVMAWRRGVRKGERVGVVTSVTGRGYSKEAVRGERVMVGL